MRKATAAFAIILVLLFAPVRVANAGGGGGFMSFAITVVAAVALTAIGNPELAFSFQSFLADPAAVIGQALDTIATNIANPSLWVSNLTSDFGINAIVHETIIGMGENLGACFVGASDCGGDSDHFSAGGLNLYVVTDNLSQLVAGEGAKLSGSVTNNGSTAIEGAFTNRFEIFADSVIVENSADLAPSPILASVPNGLPAGSSADISTVWYIPAAFAPGQYFLRLCANVGDSVTEANSENNCGDLRSFTVLAPTSTQSRAGSSADVALERERTGIPSAALSAQAFGSGSGGDLTAGVPTIVPLPTGETKVVFCAGNRYLDQNTGQCIPNGYVSCAPAGFPNRFCPSGQVCTADGQCESTSGIGGNVSSDFGQLCLSAPNSCGQTGQGFYDAHGACPARPPLDSQCLPPKISAMVVPAHVRSGSSCTLSWTITNATSCTLSSNGSDAGLPESIPLSGSYVSPALTGERTYTFSCRDGTVVSGSANATCRITPIYNEQ